MTLSAADIFSPLGLDDSNIAIAVSGGPDSIALAMLLNEYAKSHNITCHCLIVDHKLRCESTSEAQLVKLQLENLGFICKILTWNEAKPNSNIHESARKARYKLMTEYCKAHNVSILMLGHHFDDQVETIFMRIMRGSGVDGISGMQKVSSMNGITLIRPLLEIPKAKLLEYLKSNHISYVTDPSNTNERFERTRVRSQLETFSPVWKSRLVLLAKNSTRASSYLKEQATIAFEEIIISRSPLKFDLLKFKQLHPEIALRVLNLLIKPKNAKPSRLSSLENMHTNLASNNPKTSTLGGFIFKVSRNSVTLIPE